MPPEEEGRERKRRETPDRLRGRTMSRAEWEYVRWRKFTWLPGDISIIEPGRKRENRTDDRDEEEQDEGA